MKLVYSPYDEDFIGLYAGSPYKLPAKIYSYVSILL